MISYLMNVNFHFVFRSKETLILCFSRQRIKNFYIKYNGKYAKIQAVFSYSGSNGSALTVP